MNRTGTQSGWSSLATTPAWWATTARRRTLVLGLALLLLPFFGGCGDDDGGNNNENGNGNGVCGDGVLAPGEQCDRGAENSDTAPDGCRSDCREAYCGDGVVDTGEQCEDGNAIGDDGCSASCEQEPGWDCSTGSCEPVCGDGLAVGPETCDGADLRGETCVSIGQAVGELACSTLCAWDITGCTGTTVCGDGVREGDEQCDDGNLVSCDGCSDGCMVEACGNGRVECNEQCDDANGDNTDACLDGVGGTCRPAVCGDGFVRSGQEGCDDGDGDNTDACPDGVGGTCQPAVCGDGFVWSGQENCDGGLGGETCTSQTPAFSGGSLACSGSCLWDTSGRTLSPGLTWVSIPGGTFQMGSTTGHSNAQPVHQVTVPAFELTATEVTVSQYGVCVTAGSCTAPGTSWNCNWNDPGYEEHPVNCVSWQQSVDFCAWAGGRLPSEAEWEYAARSGGQAIEYPWGNDTATCTYAVLDDGGGSGCGTGRTWSACSKPAGNTSQGLCDMAGNVWEWVQDWYHSSYTGAPTDGSAWESPSASFRVERGGSFYYYAYSLCAASRTGHDPSDSYYALGFRCARDAP